MSRKNGYGERDGVRTLVQSPHNCRFLKSNFFPETCTRIPPHGNYMVWLWMAPNRRVTNPPQTHTQKT